jgi:hypothetical protein
MRLHCQPRPQHGQERVQCGALQRYIQRPLHSPGDGHRNGVGIFCVPLRNGGQHRPHSVHLLLARVQHRRVRKQLQQPVPYHGGARLCQPRLQVCHKGTDVRHLAHDVWIANHLGAGV